MMHHLVLLVLTLTLSAAEAVEQFYRCCDHGKHYSLDNGMCVSLPKSVSNTDTDIPVYENTTLQNKLSADSFSIITAPNWCNNGTTRFLLEEEFYLQVDGRIYIPHDTKPYMERDSFCITYDTDNKEYMVFGCDQEVVQEQRYNTLGMILSLPFLLVTFLVHACVPELQNLHGKCLMCYVLTLLIAYVFLVIVQLAKAVITHEFCVTAPFIIYFAFMVSFMWLNVMCIDICVTFSGRRGYTGARLRGSEDKRFFIYSLYAWGVPLIMLIVAMILQFTPDLPVNIITPKFGESKCWFPDDKSLGLFFYGPILLVILVNLGLFAYTTLKIWSIQRDTDKSMRNESQRHGDDADKQRYKLYLKLMFVFGVNWLMEIVSWLANGPSWLWYVTDMCNALYGVLIFFIFVCKANVWKLVKKRYHVMMGRPYLASTFGPTSSTRSTGTSNLSTTDVGGGDSIALRSA